MQRIFPNERVLSKYKMNLYLTKNHNKIWIYLPNYVSLVDMGSFEISLHNQLLFYYVLAEKTEVKVNESPKKSGAECEMDPSSKEELPKKVSPIMMKCMAEVVKPKKGRGGWPKGRKRKPELLNLPPKAPATGYTLYLNEERKLFKNSSLAFHEITKIIGNRWSSLTLDEKKPYLDKAEEDKKRSENYSLSYLLYIYTYIL
ncbi:unnamed protein product [Acanthoscelides obtectus]|uniref:HMG box domain-containing protein n=1 Tax=Acanthoscelides obtectus TaxID=200917 RepID=A0A9P0PF38_ACAOB|nr:unnamed protein product [Acanthoscelides obtectus]CAK1661929.1 High mobility group protein 20A [Acanthoscelides obtectus]